MSTKKLSRYSVGLVDESSVGMIIEQVRLGQKLNQREFAKKYGITQRWLSEIESGDSKKTLTKLFTLFRALDIDIIAEFDA